MRATFTRLHRWAGLITAAFLFFSGVTGAVISWDHEIDEWLNSRLFVATSNLPARNTVDLARLVEQRDPRARVVSMRLTPEQGESLSVFVLPRIDPAIGKRYALDYNQVFLDAGTGDELGRRFAGAAWPVTRRISSPSSTGCTIRCTSPNSGAATAGACGCSASSLSSGLSTVSSAST